MEIDKEEIKRREESIKEKYTIIDDRYDKPLLNVVYYDKILPYETLYVLLEIKELLEELKNKRNESN